MNPTSDFLLFDPDAIVNVDLAFPRVSMVVLAHDKQEKIMQSFIKQRKEEKK